jgi:hypothetical protein
MTQPIGGFPVEHNLPGIRLALESAAWVIETSVAMRL